MNSKQVTGQQEATGQANPASGDALSPLSGNSGSEQGGQNPTLTTKCTHNNLNAINHRTVGGEEYTRWACLTDGCEVDYWADCDGTEIDPEDVEQELADAEAEYYAAEDYEEHEDSPHYECNPRGRCEDAPCCGCCN